MFTFIAIFSIVLFVSVLIAYLTVSLHLSLSAYILWHIHATVIPHSRRGPLQNKPITFILFHFYVHLFVSLLNGISHSCVCFEMWHAFHRSLRESPRHPPQTQFISFLFFHCASLNTLYNIYNTKRCFVVANTRMMMMGWYRVKETRWKFFSCSSHLALYIQQQTTSLFSQVLTRVKLPVSNVS